MPLRQSVNKGGLGNRRAADARAKAMLPTIREFKSANIVKVSDIVAELNQRRVLMPRGAKKWDLTGVSRLLTRLRRIGCY